MLSVWLFWSRFLSLARSKLRLCSANHRSGYQSDLPCDWPKTDPGPRETHGVVKTLILRWNHFRRKKYVLITTCVSPQVERYSINELYRETDPQSLGANRLVYCFDETRVCFAIHIVGVHYGGANARHIEAMEIENRLVPIDWDHRTFLIGLFSPKRKRRRFDEIFIIRCHVSSMDAPEVVKWTAGASVGETWHENWHETWCNATPL